MTALENYIFGLIKEGSPYDIQLENGLFHIKQSAEHRIFDMETEEEVDAEHE